MDKWEEYDHAARDLARKGLKGEIGDPLPLGMSAETVALINEDPDAFEERVRMTAYALAMEQIDIREEENATPDIEWGERCAALCESLGIDQDSIAYLELMTTDTEYRAYLSETLDAIKGAIRQVSGSERDYEYDSTKEALITAGFSEDAEEDDTWTRDTARVVLTMKRRQHEFWYEFILESNGIEELRGKSGEFGKLLEAVGIPRVKPA